MNLNETFSPRQLNRANEICRNSIGEELRVRTGPKRFTTSNLVFRVVLRCGSAGVLKTFHVRRLPGH